MGYGPEREGMRKGGGVYGAKREGDPKGWSTVLKEKETLKGGL